MPSTEIEIQVKISSNRKLLAFLKKNARLISQGRQVDQYYTPAHRNFLAIRPVREWLRLRKTDQDCSLNYKNWHFDRHGKSHYCDEYETVVDNYEQAKKIFRVLNFKHIITVDKIRQTWQYRDYEIAVDTVKRLGNFVEIEYKGTRKANPARTTAAMVDFLKTIGCGTIKRNYVGYPFQLLFKNEVRHETQ